MKQSTQLMCYMVNARVVWSHENRYNFNDSFNQLVDVRTMRNNRIFIVAINNPPVYQNPN